MSNMHVDNYVLAEFQLRAKVASIVALKLQFNNYFLTFLPDCDEWNSNNMLTLWAS